MILAGLDLLQVLDGSLIDKLIRDPVLLCDVVYAVCKPEADTQVTDEQFGYVAYVQGHMVREKPAACFYMGSFFAESLLLAETGNAIGAIQIAGTAQPAQLPFFVAACDYTLIGEEFFAASAYLSGEPDQLGSLKGQDAGKLLVLLRGGAIPMAYVYPPDMRATRDLMRRRLYFTRKRGELFSHVQNTFHQYNLVKPAGDMNTATEICRSLNPLRSVLAKWIPGYGGAGRMAIAEQKFWMECLGMAGGPVRAPCAEMTEEAKAQMRADLEATGLPAKARAAGLRRRAA